MASTADPAGALNGLLMQLAAGGPAPGALPGTDEMVAQLAGDDPLKSLLVRQVLERHDRVDDDEDEPAAPGPDPQALARQRAARRQLREMRDELMALRERNDALASALGACYLCWGEDRRCAVCGGHGTPGTMAPERDEFARYVAPALKHLQPRGGTRRGDAGGLRAPHEPQPERRPA
ncbi:MAG TPA: hypothetical protein VFJ82_14540 [Longimicrobium sp.]|nr:hypothetical protein [Longimicrobium sp.]